MSIVSPAKSRQLTEYREWSNGRKGCLFYVPYLANIDVLILGGIYLIDAYWRKNDTLGDFDKLHQYEWDLLNDENCIIGGFTAFMYAQNWTYSEHKDDVCKHWRQYCTSINKKSGREYSAMDHLKAECICWAERKPDLLNLFCSASDHENPDRLLDLLITNELDQLASNINSLMWDVKTVIHTSDVNVSFQAKNAMPALGLMDDNGTESDRRVAGFKASFINYLASRNAVQAISELDTLEKKVKLLLGCFDSKCRIFTLDQIVFDIYGTNCKALFDSYLKMTKPFAVNRAISDSALLQQETKQKQEWRYFKELIRMEDNFYKGMSINKYLTKEQNQVLDTYVHEFFNYLLLQIKGDVEEANYTELINDLFEEEDNLPEEGDYVKLAKWLKRQKSSGNDYYADADNNRSLMCRKLRKIIGWLPNEGSLRKAQQRY